MSTSIGPTRSQAHIFSAPVRTTVTAFQAAPAGVRFAMVLVMADVFFSFSRVWEMYHVAVGPVSLAMTVRGLIFLAALLSGQLIPILASPISRGMLLFTTWIMLCSPFSSWRGGSVNMILHFWLPSLVAFLAINALPKYTQDIRRCMYAIGLASIFIGVMSLFANGSDATRFDLGGEGTLSNANDLAQMVLLGLPAIILFLQLNKGRKYIFRLLLLVGIVLILKVAASTASRTGVLTLMFYGIVLFWSASGLNRIKMGAILMAVGLVFFATAPKATLLRYATVLPFVSADAVDEESGKVKESAEASSTLRRALFQESLDLTLHNPVFGVGPGTYDSAAANESKDKGIRAKWRPSHNTYTQVSAECGIPGFLIYVATMLATFIAVWRVRKRTAGIPGLDNLHRLSLALLMTLGCFALTAAFANLAYLTTFPILAALSDALYRTAQREIAARTEGTTASLASATARNGLRLRPTPA